MATLRQIITEAVGEDNATEKYFSELSYSEETLAGEARLIGTVPDGINRAKVYAPSCGGWHVSTQVYEYWTECVPEGLIEDGE